MQAKVARNEELPFGQALNQMHISKLTNRSIAQIVVKGHYAQIVYIDAEKGIYKPLWHWS